MKITLKKVFSLSRQKKSKQEIENIKEKLRVKCEVRDYFISEEIIVLFLDSRQGLHLPVFRNIVAFNDKGLVLWEAQFPGDYFREDPARDETQWYGLKTIGRSDYYSSMDYDNIEKSNSFRCGAFSSYICNIDVKTGKIIDLIFTK